MNTKPLHHWTPTLLSRPISKALGKPVYLKMECYQPVGSFKIRGIGHLCQYYEQQGKTQFVSSSGGNAGLAAAYAGNKLGIKTTVFLPSTSNQVFVKALKLENAEVVVKGKVWDEANQAAMAYAKEIDAGFIPPFDHPLIWEGHSTMIDEIADEGIKPECVAVAVGGGGLASGLLEGMHRRGWQNVPLISVETEGSASLARSIESNKIITLDKIDTIATSLGAKRVCENIFNWTKKHTFKPVTVSDQATVNAIRFFLDDHRSLVEPASAAALSIVYDKLPVLNEYKSILVIVCGGVGISLDILNSYNNLNTPNMK